MEYINEYQSLSENLYGLDGIFDIINADDNKKINIEEIYTITNNVNTSNLGGSRPEQKKEIFKGEKEANFFEISKRAINYYKNFVCDVGNYIPIWKEIEALNKQQQILLTKQNDLRFKREEKTRGILGKKGDKGSSIRSEIDELKLEVRELKKDISKNFTWSVSSIVMPWE